MDSDRCRSRGGDRGSDTALIDELRDLDLASGDWALFGSGPLFLRGWIERVNDLDVIARGPAFRRAQTLGTPEPFDDGGVLYRIGDDITVGDYWYYGELDIDVLIDTAELLDDIPCVRIEHIIAYKRIADRPQDREHLAAIEANL